MRAATSRGALMALDQEERDRRIAHVVRTLEEAGYRVRRAPDREGGFVLIGDVDDFPMMERLEWVEFLEVHEAAVADWLQRNGVPVASADEVAGCADRPRADGVVPGARAPGLTAAVCIVAVGAVVLGGLLLRGCGAAAGG